MLLLHINGNVILDTLLNFFVAAIRGLCQHLRRFQSLITFVHKSDPKSALFNTKMRAAFLYFAKLLFVPSMYWITGVISQI